MTNRTSDDYEYSSDDDVPFGAPVTTEEDEEQSMNGDASSFATVGGVVDDDQRVDDAADDDAAADAPPKKRKPKPKKRKPTQQKQKKPKTSISDPVVEVKPPEKRKRGRPPKATTPSEIGEQPRSRRPVQEVLPGAGVETVDEIEDAAAAYVDVRDRRMELTKREVAAQEQLLAAMRNAGLKRYRCAREDYEVEVVSKDEKAKVKSVSAGADGDEE